ncbi:hypothetical protein B0H13DRAFT_1851343 [Mycena leptocephala]|nr:hypothetical protein B0H13DRAFT_1851343 [Mycena leptocephala]
MSPSKFLCALRCFEALNRLLFALVIIKRHNFKLRSSSPPTTLRLSPSPVAEIDPSTPKYAIFAIFTHKDATSKPQPRTEIDPILTLNASKPGVIQKNAIRIAPNGLGVYLCLYSLATSAPHIYGRKKPEGIAWLRRKQRIGKEAPPCSWLGMGIGIRCGSAGSASGGEEWGEAKKVWKGERSSFRLREFDYALTDTNKEDPTRSVIVEAALALLKYLHSSSPCSDHEKILFEKKTAENDLLRHGRKLLTPKTTTPKSSSAVAATDMMSLRCDAKTFAFFTQHMLR